MPLTFASWDGEPIIVDRGIAWVIKDGRWSMTRLLDPVVEARVISPEAFAAKFPDAPKDLPDPDAPLPAEWPSTA